MNVENWPCSRCSAGVLSGGSVDALCDDCFAIMRAEDRQRRELDEIYSGERSRGVSDYLPDEPDTRDRNLGKRASDETRLPNLWDSTQE